MGRIRTVKPEILEDEKPAAMTNAAWRLWVSMYLLADDYGRLRGSPDWLKAQVFWHRNHSGLDVVALVRELASLGVIRCYQVAGQQYIQITNWDKHQKVDHPSAPRIPPPDVEPDSPVLAIDSRNPLETIASIPETLAPDLDLDPDPDPDPDQTDPQRELPLAPVSEKSKGPSFDFEAVYALYPRKKGRTKGAAAFKRQIKTQEDYEALLIAVKHYAQTAQAPFVKHFDTFMGCWRDWIETEPISAPIANGSGRGFMPPRAAVKVGGEVKF